MKEVALRMVKCGEWRKKQPDSCFLSIPDSSPRLDFIYRHDDFEHVTFQCENISAIDIRVEAKFGAIDTLKGTIIVECLSPVCVNTSADTSFGGQCFIVKATFNVDETGAVRDIVRQLRTACSSEGESPSRQEDINNENTKLQAKEREVESRRFKEGLPGWVCYIPHHLYSRRTRRSIELAICVYMIFSVMWALWQLYNHVDFVRECVRPVIDMVKYQFHLLDSMVQMLNMVFEEYTTQWLCFIKPLHTVLTTLTAPLLQFFGQLSPLFQTILQASTMVWGFFQPVIKPVLSIGYHLIKCGYIILNLLKTLATRMWITFYSVPLPIALKTRLRPIKRVAVAVYQGLGQARHLDPLKAQFVVMRTTVITSCKALSLALIHLAKQVYKFIWLKRSAKVNVKRE